MSTYNWTNGSIEGTKKQHATTPRGFKPFVLRNVVDTSLQNISAAAHVIQALAVPAGVTVLSCHVNILTVDAAASVFSLGITGTDTSKWGSGIATATEGVVEPTGGPIFNPFYFSAADTIDLLSDGAAIEDTSKIEVIAVCVKSNSTIDAGE